jgi:hypothetical protein
MQAALAENMPGLSPIPLDLIANNEDDQPENQIDDDGLMREAVLGFDRLRRMSHTELRDVIRSRVGLLETELREREDRRKALDTARAASKILDLHKERAKRIHRNVNLGSALAAVASTFLIVFVMV